VSRIDDWSEVDGETQALVHQGRSGDVDAIMDLIEGCDGQLSSGVRNGIAFSHLIQDALSEARFLVVQRFHQYNGDGSDLCGWIWRIARNAAVTVHRKEARHSGRAVSFETGAIDQIGEPGGQADVDRDLMVEHLLAVLPPQDSQLLKMRYLFDLSADEIAKRLGKSPGHIRRQIRRSLERAAELANNQDVDR
jgi:RNA polymerase sigma-70 factor (ECF subfamily)